MSQHVANPVSSTTNHNSEYYYDIFRTIKAGHFLFTSESVGEGHPGKVLPVCRLINFGGGARHAVDPRLGNLA